MWLRNASSGRQDCPQQRPELNHKSLPPLPSRQEHHGAHKDKEKDEARFSSLPERSLAGSNYHPQFADEDAEARGREEQAARTVYTRNWKRDQGGDTHGPSRGSATIPR